MAPSPGNAAHERLIDPLIGADKTRRINWLERRSEQLWRLFI
jgi:hypothetical protein